MYIMQVREFMFETILFCFRNIYSVSVVKQSRMVEVSNEPEVILRCCKDGETILLIPKRSIKNHLTVEPMLVLNVIAIGAMMVTIKSFTVDSLCLERNTGLNGTFVDCENLTAYKDDGKHLDIFNFFLLNYANLRLSEM